MIEREHRQLLERGPADHPSSSPATIINLAAGHVSIRTGRRRGRNSATATACATGGHAIGDSTKSSSDGHADVMICGGSEAGICEMGVAGFSNMKALSTRNDDPQGASRPFDAERDGFVLGEGAGMLVLEAEDHALARGARILAEILAATA